MHSSLILWPVLAQVALTLAMFILLAIRKAQAIKAGGFNRKDAALDNKAWPANVVKVSNNIANQFETPVLFYVLALLFHAIDGVGTTVIVLAWVYVASRYAHAFVHVGINYVPRRLQFFTVGVVLLLAMTGLAAWTLAT
jgi:hypothetical protein